MTGTHFLARSIVCCLLATCATLLPGCGYGEVSPQAYQYAKALYSISQRRDAPRLELLRGKIEVSLEKQEISDKESAWLDDLIAEAEAGQWEAAAQGARQMMDDQSSGP